MTCQVGFIGLGDQGAPMAQMILSGGFPLDVWSRRPASSAPLVEAGAVERQSPAELGARCDVVGICVLDDAGVEDVVLAGGLLDAMTEGSILLIHSTVAPATCARLGVEADSRGVHVLDAPVSGGAAGALRRSLSVIVGGDVAAFERARPVLETYVSNIRHVGRLGSAQAIKLVNNTLFVANVAMAGAALALGEELGIDPAVLTDVVGASSGRSAGLEAYAPLTSEWGRHAWAVLKKDVQLLESLEPGPSELLDVARSAVDRHSGDA